MISEAIIVGGCILVGASLIASALDRAATRLLQIIRIIEEWER